jgi:hypothetical protein
MARRRIVTPAVLATIRCLLERGLNAPQIAETIGCTLGTLRVRCSQAQISLRGPRPVKSHNGHRGRRNGQSETRKKAEVFGLGGALAAVSSPITAPIEGSYDGKACLSVALSRDTIDQFRERSALNGMSVADLAAAILEIVARDVLYAAVLDTPSWKRVSDVKVAA